MDGTTSVVSSILNVFTDVADWLIESLSLIPNIFWTAEKGLTFIGAIALISGGFAITFGLIRLIRAWLKSR